MLNASKRLDSIATLPPQRRRRRRLRPQLQERPQRVPIRLLHRRLRHFVAVVPMPAGNTARYSRAGRLSHGAQLTPRTALKVARAHVTKPGAASVTHLRERLAAKNYTKRAIMISASTLPLAPQGPRRQGVAPPRDQNCVDVFKPYPRCITGCHLCDVYDMGQSATAGQYTYRRRQPEETRGEAVPLYGCFLAII